MCVASHWHVSDNVTLKQDFIMEISIMTFILMLRFSEKTFDIKHIFKSMNYKQSGGFLPLLLSKEIK